MTRFSRLIVSMAGTELDKFDMRFFHQKVGITAIALRRILLMALITLPIWGCSNAHSASKTILVLGDSLSAEYGLPRDTGWVALLQQRLQSKNNSARLINVSISGETTSGGRARLPALLQQHHPSVVIIELGGNDGLRGLPINTIESNLRAMILAARNARSKVLLVGMRIPPNYGRAYTEQFSAMYRKLAKETGASLVPFLLEGIADKPAMFQLDRIHPVTAAQPYMLNNVWPYLLPFLK